MSLRANLLLSLWLCATPAWAAVDFDGADDSIDFGSAASLDNAFYSVYADFEVQGTGDTTAQRIFSKGLWHIIYSDADADGSHDLFLDHDCVTTQFQRRGGAQSINTRYRLVVKWDRSGTAANAEIYINGAQVSYATTQNCVGGLISDAPEDLCLGNDSAIPCAETRSFDGLIYEVAFWSIELTDAEAVALTQPNRRIRLGPTQVQPANLILYSTLDDEEGGSSADADTFFDRSGNGNNGTGADGAGNAGLTAVSEPQLSYP